MQHRRYLFVLGLVICVFPFVNAPECRANLVFDVSLNTSPLLGPFFIDFQLIDGTGIGDSNNTVNLSEFDVNGGILITPPLTLEDTTFFNEVEIPFIPGSSLSFRVDLSTNIDAGSAPDAFSFAVLDFGLKPLPTTGLGDALLLVDINQKAPVIETFNTSPASPFHLSAPQVTVVPDTGSSISMLLIGLGALWCLRGHFLRIGRSRCRAVGCNPSGLARCLYASHGRAGMVPIKPS